MSLDYLGARRLDAIDEANRIVALNTTIPLIPPGKAPWEGSANCRCVVATFDGAPLGETTSLADDPDDSATDRRYEVAVAHEQGKSLIYILASSIGEVKRNMRQKEGYVVLSIKVHGEEEVAK